MKPSRPPNPRPGHLSRRSALLLAGGGLACASLGRPAQGASGFGPLRLGMTRVAALRALGAAALPVPLCAGLEGVMFDWPDPVLSPRPVPGMAMFGMVGGRIGEMEASLSRPEGGLDEAGWRAAAVALRQEWQRRLGLEPVSVAESGDAMGALLQWRFDAPDAALSVAARWMRRSGASYTRLHWLAAGQEAAITG
jgi:hypothetical protein